MATLQNSLVFGLVLGLIWCLGACSGDGKSSDDNGFEPGDGGGDSGDSGYDTGDAVGDGGSDSDINGDDAGDGVEDGGLDGSTDCTRDTLKSIVDTYYTALAAHDPSGLPLATDVKFTENGEQIAVGEGLWKTAGTPKLRRSMLDTEICTSVTESVISEGSEDIVLGVRLKLVGQEITEIETIVVRTGDGFINTAALLETQSDDWETVLPTDQRPTREQLKEIVDRYFMLFPDGACNFAADCVRHENGFSPGSCTGFGIGCPDPDAATDPSMAVMVPRQYVLDVEAGIACGFVMWRGMSTDFHMFKVRDGEIKAVHAVLIEAESSGWD